MPFKARLWKIARWSIRSALLLIVCLLSTGSNPRLSELEKTYRSFTRSWEFDFFRWTLKALGTKLENWSLGRERYLAEDDRSAMVLDYIDLVDQARRLEADLTAILGDPSVENPEKAAAEIWVALGAVRAHQDELQTLVESILAEQTSEVLAELGLEIGGTVFPPVTFHFSRVPVALVISPRSVIRQDAIISLDPDMTIKQQIELEANVEAGKEYSALVVPIGGVGIYPTMVQESSALVWLTDTIVHEWVHNFLTLRPLGIRYGVSPELRTMNETAASLMGKEIGRQVLIRYYPSHVPPEESIEEEAGELPPVEQEPPAFDFRAEMHETRVTVDSMLLEGEIEAAEEYMEARRQMFWQQGYRIRRLNQAYFAFYGAYADQPGGAAGEDPVGTAVRELWQRTQSPEIFLRTMGAMREFSDLLAALTDLDATR
ncbi:MAG: hypothetical protein PVF70_05610 [Anaerolineales bacterium]|jgi:hypothetical protein